MNTNKIWKHISKKPENWLFTLLLSLCVLCIGGIILLSKKGKLVTGSFDIEIAKTLLQILSVAVIGTTATLLLKIFDRQQDRRQRARDTEQEQKRKIREALQAKHTRETQLKKDILNRINEAYSGIKNARRMMRAKAFKDAFYKSTNETANVYLLVYDEYIEDINSVQLALEIISKDIQIAGLDYKLEMINPWIERMIKLLDEIITEYEQKRPNFRGEPAVSQISNLPHLKQFLESKKSSQFRDFFDNYKLLMTHLQENILQLKLVNS